MSLKKEAKELLRDALRAGWYVVRQSKHVIVRHPDGRQDTISLSPSDYRGLVNKRKRMGLWEEGRRG
jgi:predicted RNA binding protein YcfA (HicA-like mRNA interferase family)